ncbi:MAG: DUF3108 domain-containing protein [Proteobacteria bacterium]|nr:DUF3108 domain-containing protein [Pseudomonadota bacterium]
MRQLAFGIFLATATFAAHAADLAPANATYSVVRDGKVIGDAKYSLAANADGTWTLRSEMHGTSGVARLVGLDVREESTFRWNGGKVESLRYDYRQQATFKNTIKHIDFDRAGKQAHSRDGKSAFDYAIPADALDRTNLTLVLGAAAANGQRDLTLPVAGRDHLEPQHFLVKGEETISVPAGSFKTWRYERDDMPGKARSWYSPATGLLPVRFEKAQGDGSVIALELKQR